MSDPRDESPATPETPSAPPARPAQPAFGEYAPEGWEWKPEPVAAELTQDGTASASAAPGTSGQNAAGAPAAGSGSPASSATPQTLAGVPHNLGAPGARNAGGAGAPAGAAPLPPVPPGAAEQAPDGSYRASTPPAPLTYVPPAGGAPRPRIGDRVITIMLLVLAAFGALNISSSFFGLERQIGLSATMLDIESPKIASWIGPLGVVSGLVVLLLFALTLIYSIQRMRAGKLTFWVPLTAGAIAMIIMIVVPMVAMSGAPEIMEQLSTDPSGSLDKMLDYLQNMQTP